MRPVVLARRPGLDRATAGGLAVGAALAVGLLALVDPERSHVPACPTYALLGLDCPACGTLRGVHDLGRGRLVDALDHNLLLLVAAPAGAWLWWRWVQTAAGRPPAPVPAGRTRLLAVVAVVLAVAFTVLRNLPVDPTTWLAAT
jgi:hypothetical protein